MHILGAFNARRLKPILKARLIVSALRRALPQPLTIVRVFLFSSPLSGADRLSTG